MKNKMSGQITVFSAIILLSVLILASVLVDIARISAGRAMVKRAANTAARSILSDYGSRLKENYGLFALPVNDEELLNNIFEEYLSCNLSIPGDEGYYKDSTDLFGFRIERVKVTPMFNMSENLVTKQQILEYMKYRAPAGLVEGFMERLSAIKDIGKMSSAYKKKVGIDKILGKMDKYQQKLKKNIDGTGSSGEKYINGFNLGGNWEEAYHSFNSLSAALASIKSSVDSVDAQISELEEQMSQNRSKEDDNTQGDNNISCAEKNTAGNGNCAAAGESTCGVDDSSSGGSLDDTDSIIESLRKDRLALEQRFSDTNIELRQTWDKIRFRLTDDYIKSNENAVQEIKKIVEKGNDAKKAIIELEKYLNENFGSEEGIFSIDFKEQTNNELDSFKSIILDGQRAEEMLRNVNGNSLVLNNVAAKLDDIGRYLGTENNYESKLPIEMLEMIKGYKNISYNYSKPAKGDKCDDPRAGKADAVKEFIVEKILKDVNYTSEGILEKDLPSHTKAVTASFDKEDEEFADIQNQGNENIDFAEVEARYEGNLKNLDAEVDLYDEEGSFQENALGFISEIGNIAAGEASALRDNIYLNEYIMGTFKNSVSSTDEESETSKDMNFHCIDKDTLQTFYDSEVEYILHGNASQKLNNIMTKGELLLVRFGMNTLHVYTDGKKKTMAATIASAVAGWWTGGAGIPIISNLIMCGWGMGEAVIDVADLMEGKSVPIYKMDGDWRLDIGLPMAAGPKTDQRLYFNYQDYLRLFLLTMSENKKLDRLEDLIQLNMDKYKSGFKMSGSNTFVRVEAEVSMKYIFITKPFVRKALNTNDGRFVFRVLVYEGY